MRRAAAHEELGEHQGALRDYLEAHRLAPANPYAALNVGLAALRLSRYDIGWKMWESRRFVPTFRSLSPEIASRALHWDGTASLANKTIFVYPEQGYGDGVQFMRYLDQLTAMNAIVLLGLPAALEPLYAAVPGVTLLMQGETIGAIDFHCPLTSIPAALLEAGVEIGIPPPFRPIAGEAKATAWAKTLGPRVKPRIGLVVSGSAAHNNDANRSIALAELAPLLSLPFEFVLLQPDLRATDAATAVQFGVKTLTQGLRDFSDTAAIAELCDLVISVDSAPAHVVASLGRPTWLLLPYLADWRWGIMTESSPWYPSLRLWRQGRDRQWSNVIDRARLQLLASPELDGMAS
jgi:hypothetical protein